MEETDLIELMFGGLDQLGPGSDSETRRVISALPKRRYSKVLDAGCGNGRQTFVEHFDSVDLLWSEGAAYSIGFENALRTWKSALSENGILAVTELCWLKEERSKEVCLYFEEGYPDMRTVAEIRSMASEIGYHVLTEAVLPPEVWTDVYYRQLQARAEALLKHEEQGVRQFAKSSLEEIEIFNGSNNCYGYVFFIFEKI